MIFTNNTFKGHYPVGTAAVISARDAEEAATKLTVHLAKIGLKQDEPIDPKDMKKFSNIPGNVVILVDGNY